MGRGRPLKYDPEYCGQVEKLCRLHATDEDIADFLGVSIRTLYNWKLSYPEFLHALKRTREEVDAQVEQSLYRRAMGYSHRAVKFFQAGGAIIEKKYTEHYPPDATSMIFWLKNRQPEKWRDRREVLTGDTEAGLNDPDPGV